MRKSLLLTAFLLLGSLFLFAQKKELTGRVVDAQTGEAISGVNILSDNKKATVTRQDGSFTLSVSGAKNIVVTHSGYQAQTVEIGTQTNFDIRLALANTTLEDVVVIGYGTQRKSLLTGAISKVKNEKMEEAPVARLDQVLQGRIAGVQIENTSSEAGSDPKIRVRGLSSVNAGASPLVVVDGLPVPDGLSYVNPADVESVEVLKDAASAAIYGSRGSSGVIIITTKSGKAERPRYNVKLSAGDRNPYALYPMMTMTEYGNLLFYEASLKAKDPNAVPLNTNSIMTANERAAYVIENTIMGGRPTDWQRQALRTAHLSNIQMSVSGGKREVKYYISGAYQKDPGMMYHSEFDRLSFRTKLDAQLSRRVKIAFNLNPTYIKRERPSTSFIDFVRFYSFLPVYHTEASAAFVNQASQGAGVKAGDFAQARHFNGRVYSGYMPDGSLWTTTASADPFSSSNNTPKSIMEMRNINSNEYRMQGSSDITVNLAQGLDFKAMVSGYVNNSKGVDYARRGATSDGSVNRGVFSDRLYIDLLSENTFTYSKQVKDHSFEVLAGFTAQKTTVRDQQTTALDFPNDNNPTLSSALTIDRNPANTYDTSVSVGLLSYLGRINYNYKGKYLLSTSLRADGSSKFAPGKKWGVFPAVSAGWLMSRESFMEKTRWIDNLKLRASYGISGNNQISNFVWLDNLFSANYDLGQGNGSVVAGTVPSPDLVANPEITWERTAQLNFGVDATFWNNFLSLSVDYYISKSEQLLLRQATMAITGAPQTYNNIGRLQNNGIEVEATANLIRKKDFRWTISGNIAHNRNKLLELYGNPNDLLLNQGERTELYQNKVGAPFIQFYGYKTNGVWTSQAQIDTARARGLYSNLSNYFAPGGLRLVDLDGNDTLDTRDRTVIGTPYPDFTWGVSNTFSYKNFDLSILVQGSQGGQLVNGDPNYNETKRINRNYNTNRWLSPLYPGDGKTPYSTVGFNWMLTDYVVEDASYYAVREVIIGYTFPAKWMKRVGLNSARVYFSAQNLYYHFADSYRGINPEARFSSGVYANSLYDGYQRGSYPLPKTFLVGIDLNF